MNAGGFLGGLQANELDFDLGTGARHPTLAPPQVAPTQRFQYSKDEYQLLPPLLSNDTAFDCTAPVSPVSPDLEHSKSTDLPDFEFYRSSETE